MRQFGGMWQKWAVLGLLVTLLVGQAFSPLMSWSGQEAEAAAAEPLPVGTGTRYHSYSATIGGYPQQVYTLRVDLSQPYVKLKSTLANGRVVGLATLSQQMAQEHRAGHLVVGGVNGDFFSGSTPVGLTSDVLIQGGQLVASPGSGYAFGVTADNRPLIGKPQWRVRVQTPQGEVAVDAVNRTRGTNQLVLYTELFSSNTLTNEYGTEVILQARGRLTAQEPVQAQVVEIRDGVGRGPLAPGQWVLSAHGSARQHLQSLQVGDELTIYSAVDAPWDQVQEAVGGHPLLVYEGRIQISPQNPSFDNTRAPRTAVGITADNQVLLVTVDGRQPGYSQGLTIPELAQLMREMGAVYALNLDGGGSATFAVRPLGEQRAVVANRPSDGRERNISSALLVISTAPAGDLHRLYVMPESVPLLAGSRVQFTVKGQDQYDNPVPLTATSVEWSVEGEAGQVSSSGELVTNREEQGLIRVVARSGEVTQSAQVRVVNQPARLEVTPASLTLAKGETALLKVQAYDQHGQALLTSPEALQWTVDEKVGSITPQGQLHAAANSARGHIRISYGDLSVQVPVTVGDPIPFPDIEGTGVEEEIRALVDAGVLRGFPDGTFKPAQSMTRAQMAKVLTLTAGWAPVPDVATAFRDVTDPEHKGYVGALVAQGITTGTAPATFSPYHSLTRQQMATFFIRAMGLEGVAQELADQLMAELAFTDRHLIDASHLANVALAVKIGFITGIPEGDGRYRFEPRTLAKRQQIARLGYEFMENGEEYIARAHSLLGNSSLGMQWAGQPAAPRQLIVGLGEPLDEGWLAEQGWTVIKEWPEAVLLESSSATSHTAMAELESRPEVMWVQPNYRYATGKLRAVPDPYAYQQWGNRYLGLEQAWRLMEGQELSPVTVAVIDSGVDRSHPDLAGQLSDAAYNFYHRSADVTDEHGHGTHVSGIIGAVVGNGIGIEGVAGFQWLNLLPLKVTDPQGDAYTDRIADAIQYAIEQGADVINISLGGPGSEDLFLERMINKATQAGIPVVVAAGNDGKDTAFFLLANLSAAITVGAIDQGYSAADFSNWGEALDFAAPGVDVVSTYPLSLSDTGYMVASGTSMAAPYVSGVLALLKALSPELGVDEVRELLVETAEDLAASGWDPRTGYGLVRADRAVGKLLEQKRQQEEQRSRFADVPLEYWAYDAIREVVERGVFQGYPAEGLFRPEALLTRAQAAVIMARERGLEQAEPQFADIQGSLWQWAAPYIGAVQQAGIMTGSQGLFRPDEPLTRAQWTKVLVEAYQLTDPSPHIAARFPDVHPGDWYAPYAEAAVEWGLIRGTAEGLFEPYRPITRAEVAVTLQRLWKMLEQQ